VAAYSVPAAAVWRLGVLSGEDDRIWYERDPEGFREMLRAAARSSNIDPDDLVRRVEKGINHQWYFYFRQIRGAILWPRVVLRQLRELLDDQPNARTHLYGFARELVIILTVIISFFLWNYLSSLRDAGL